MITEQCHALGRARVREITGSAVSGAPRPGSKLWLSSPASFPISTKDLMRTDLLQTT